MVNRYEPDVDGLYSEEEVLEIIQDNGIEGAVNILDFNKVPDSKLRTWLLQAETLHEKIWKHVFPRELMVNQSGGKEYRPQGRKT